MTVLAHDKLAIFSFPRAGTKLISSALEQAGYHNHGEWYDVWSSDISGQRAHRLDAQSIKHNQDLLFQNVLSADHVKLGQTIERHSLLSLQPRSVITIWYENAINFPWMFMNLEQHHWICPRRDLWAQLTSFVVSWHNNNFNGDRASQPVEVNMRWFDIFFWRWHHVRRIQEWLVSTGRGIWIDFDQLIAGQSSALGTYVVNTPDEHELPEQLILNLHDVKSRFDYLVTQVAELGEPSVDNSINKA